MNATVPHNEKYCNLAFYIIFGSLSSSFFKFLLNFLGFRHDFQAKKALTGSSWHVFSACQPVNPAAPPPGPADASSGGAAFFILDRLTQKNGSVRVKTRRSAVSFRISSQKAQPAGSFKAVPVRQGLNSFSFCQKRSCTRKRQNP